MSAREITSIYRDRPFDPSFRTFKTVEGMSIAQIVAEAHLPAYFETHGIVVLGDEEIPHFDGPIDLWKCIRPKPSQHQNAVTLQFGIRLGKGGGSGGSSGGGHHGKSTFALIATIAVFAATLFIGGGGLFTTLGLGTASSLGAGTLGAGLLAGAVSIGGSLAIAALTRPPSISPNQSVDNASIDSGSSLPTSTASQGSSSISGNALSPGAPVPRVFGIHDVTPPLLCQPLQEIIGLDEYVECVFGLAGPHRIQSIRINDTPIEALSDVTYQIVEGKPTDAIQTLVTRMGYTLQPQIQISRPRNNPTTPINVLNQVTPNNSLPTWHGFSSRKAPSELWAVLAWQQALADLTVPGTNIGVPVRIRFKRRGDAIWKNLPEIHFDSKAGTPFVKRFKFLWQTKPLSAPLAPTDEGPYGAFANVPIQTISPARGGWQADAYFWTSGISYYTAATFGTHTITGITLEDDGVNVFLDPATFPKDFYDFQIMVGNIYTMSTFSQTSTYTQSGTVYDFFGYSLSGSVAVYNRTRASVNDAVVLARVESIYNSPPITSKDFATLSIKAKNLVINKVVVEGAGYTYDWNGVEWASLTVSQNPAPHWVDCMTNLIALPIPYDLLDNASLLTWRQSCIDNNYQVNAVFTGKMLEDVADVIAGSGYARTRRSELWGVILDRDRSAEGPVQVFSPRNLTNFHFEKAFPVVPTGLRVSFDDITNNYIEKEIIVLRPGVSDDGVYQKMRYDTYVTDPEAIRRALFDLGQITERPVFYKGNAVLEFLACTKGDLVAMSHDILDYQSGFAYISSLTYDGSIPPKITGFNLDGSIPIATNDQWTSSASMWSSYASEWAASRYGILLRKLDGVLQTYEIITSAGPDISVATLKTPIVDPGLTVIKPGCVITSGRLGHEYLRLLVLDITPKEDLTADMTFVDEAPQLFPGGQPI